MRGVAFCTVSSKMKKMNRSLRQTSLLLAFAMTLAVPAAMSQDPGPVPPPRPPGEQPPGPKPPGDAPHRPNGMRPGMGFSGGGFFPRGDRDRMESFKELSEEERSKIREAFEKAWKNPAVVDARDRLTKANDDYREALHKALQEADPAVVKILEKAKPQVPKMPDPSDPEFAQKAVGRLGMEFQLSTQQERRDLPTGRIHERAIGAPAVRELIKQLEAAAPERRMEAWNRVREAYTAAVRAEFAKIRENFRDGQRRDELKGDRPQPPSPPPGDAPPKP